jgi:hypothetical protein
MVCVDLPTPIIKGSATVAKTTGVFNPMAVWVQPVDMDDDICLFIRNLSIMELTVAMSPWAFSTINVADFPSS